MDNQSPRIAQPKRRRIVVLAVFTIATLLLTLVPAGTLVVRADGTYASLSTGPLTQDWSDTSLITTNDSWSGVPSITGFLGDYTAASDAAVDPQTVLVPMTTVDVIANQTNPTITNGGVAEFQLTDPVVALQGSGTADAPNLVLYP